MTPSEKVYVQKVLQYRCRRCSQVVWVEYVETEMTEEQKTEMLERAIKNHNWMEHGE